MAQDQRPLGPSPTQQWADTATLWHLGCSRQRHWDPAPPNRGLVLVPGPVFTHQQADTSPSPRNTQPRSLPSQHPAHIPAGQYQPRDSLGPSPAYQQDTSSCGTPRTPQSAALGSTPPTSELTPASGPPGPGSTHQWADTSPRPLSPGLPTPAPRYLGPLSQPPKDLPPLNSRPAPVWGNCRFFSQLCEEEALPTSRLTLDLEPPAAEPSCSPPWATRAPGRLGLRSQSPHDPAPPRWGDGESEEGS